MRVYLFLSLLLAAADASIVSTSDARLPMSLSTVITDLEAEGCEELATVCLVTSRSVTKQEKKALVETLAGEAAEDCKALGTMGGLAIAQPDAGEAALTACACGGTILYHPNNVDLQRGEGLFDTLAPVMEKLLASKSSPRLIVVSENAAEAKQRLEQLAEGVVQNLIHDKPLSVLQDVFESVDYVTPGEAAGLILNVASKITPMDATSRVSDTVDLETMLSWSSPPSSPSAQDIAAARKLGPAAREKLVEAVEKVKKLCLGDDGNQKFVEEFGSLCDAVMKQAVKDLEKESADTPSLLKSAMGRAIVAELVNELDAELGDIFDEQVELLQLASFAACKQKMSKLLISPNLGTDMQAVASKSVAAFAKAAKKLVAKQSSWNTTPAKKRYLTLLQDFCANRLQAARASGQYKPLPRKGVTIGLHWLLPKPFGNDFRQEPWMVHASDNLVYVPKDKISDVSPEEVAAGDWRNKIVPSPVGNDMLYMQ